MVRSGCILFSVSDELLSVKAARRSDHGSGSDGGVREGGVSWIGGVQEGGTPCSRPAQRENLGIIGC